MKELYRRFNIAVNLENSLEIFRNKIENILSHGQLGEEIFETKENESDIYWELCNGLGVEYEYQSYSSGKVSHIFDELDFSEYILRLQALLDLLWNYNKKQTAATLIGIIENAVNTSPVDLGIRLKFYKQKGVQIYFSGSRFLDKKLVDDVLGVLEDEEKSAVRLAFEKGLKEFLEAKSNPPKLKNAIRDMQLACDETIKVLFKNKDLGFRHLFKDDHWKSAGLNDYQKQIFWNLNEYIDKFAKHKSDSKITTEDTENIIYLTGMFVRLVFTKKIK
ncbi:MAG: hypothetical protein Q7R79_02500 [bacterium]|nr:hypothetical protein [bacterium]